MKLNYNLNKYYKNLSLEDVNRLFSLMADLKPRMLSVEYMLGEGAEKAKFSDYEMNRWEKAMISFQVIAMQDVLKTIGAINLIAGAEVFPLTEEDIELLKHRPGTRRYEDPEWRKALLALATRYHFLMSVPEGEPDIVP